MKKVRTRFAPSPTGFLHVGGVRTALFSYLLAKRHGGEFLLRIEDTDQERLVPGAIEAIVSGFHWLGIEIDEGPSAEELKQVGAYWAGAPDIGGPKGPYIQSLRLDRYRKAAAELINSGHAYRCDCTPEMLAKEREEQAARKVPPGYGGRCRNRSVSADSKHVVRLKIPDNLSITVDDVVKGTITWQSLSLKDPVLLKSDGFPTYHLAVVVDDHEMEISHIIRADEWVPSIPIHVLLYQAFGWERPEFVHVPNVLGSDGKKLSKRHGATSVSSFIEQGYLPEALLNFLALIGWSPGEGEEQEIFTKSELISRFSLAHVNSAPGVFSYEKLNWMNGMYIRKLPIPEFTERLRPYLTGLNVDEDKLAKIIPHIQERLEKLADVPSLIDFLFTDSLRPDFPAMFQKGIDAQKAAEILRLAGEKLESIQTFTKPSIEEALRPLAEALGLKAGPVLTVIRIAITGKKATPPLFESIEALGKEIALRRLAESEGLLQTGSWQKEDQ